MVMRSRNINVAKSKDYKLFSTSSEPIYMSTKWYVVFNIDG